MTKKIVNLLIDNKVIALFQKESEIGPRALGNRSLIASPVLKEMKNILNKIKSRENFRPVAPIVLNEHKSEWFDIEKESPFMLFSVKCKNPDKIPSAIHADQTSRIQTITKENGYVYNILLEFYNRTKIPVLINTSFNTKCYPILETPKDAIETFLEQKEISVMIIHNYFIERK